MSNGKKIIDFHDSFSYSSAVRSPIRPLPHRRGRSLRNSHWTVDASRWRRHLINRWVHVQIFIISFIFAEQNPRAENKAPARLGTVRFVAAWVNMRRRASAYLQCTSMQSGICEHRRAEENRLNEDLLSEIVYAERTTVCLSVCLQLVIPNTRPLTNPPLRMLSRTVAQKRCVSLIAEITYKIINIYRQRFRIRVFDKIKE